MRGVSLVLGLVLVTGCDKATAVEPQGMERAIELVAEAQSDALAVEVPPEVIEGRAPRRDKSTPKPPEGYVLMKAIARSGDFGHAVVLVDASEKRMVPIFIGGTEALSIQLRLAHEKFTRPLTHDLLDTMLKELEVEMVRAQVDALKDGVYLGSVVVKRGEELITFDARPSDAIALAIGNDVPIFVSEKVIEAALEEEAEEQPHAKPNPIAL